MEIPVVRNVLEANDRMAARLRDEMFMLEEKLKKR